MELASQTGFYGQITSANLALLESTARDSNIVGRVAHSQKLANRSIYIHIEGGLESQQPIFASSYNPIANRTMDIVVGGSRVTGCTQMTGTDRENLR